MKEVIKYAASDGTEFDNKDTCEESRKALRRENERTIFKGWG